MGKINEITQSLHEKMGKKIQAQPVKNLCEMFTMTNSEKNRKKCDWKAIVAIRKFIQDELERRFPEKYEAWIDCESDEDFENPALFFL